KKKWSKGKKTEKVNNAVLFNQATYDKLLTEVPKYKHITPSVLSERLRYPLMGCNGGKSRESGQTLLMIQGTIGLVSVHMALILMGCTRTIIAPSS
ncbi:hypothetical protein ZWY2020_014675, partial [Hordeum vulgare]